jgi:hypothetical protein
MYTKKKRNHERSKLILQRKELFPTYTKTQVHDSNQLYDCQKQTEQNKRHNKQIQFEK